MNDPENDDFKSEYKSDKKRSGWGSIIFGLIFIIWTGFDIASNFWEDFWYANVFFILLGLTFIVFGVLDVRKYSRRNSNHRG